MNAYLIRDVNGSPVSAKADTVEQALTQTGLDLEQVASVEVMIPNALPPNNWKNVTPAKPKKLTVEQKIRAAVLNEIEGLFGGCAECTDSQFYCIDKAIWQGLKGK